MGLNRRLHMIPSYKITYLILIDFITIRLASYARLQSRDPITNASIGTPAMITAFKEVAILVSQHP